MTKHVMIDLETWSTKPNAAIISIGAVKFDLDEPVSVDSEAFHVGILPASNDPKVFDVDPGTIGWWIEKDRDQAREEWLKLEKTDIASALTAFTMWLNPPASDAYCVWGNGVDFDNVILRHAYDKVTGPMTCPWSYRSNRCFRTLKATTDGLALFAPDFGIVHTALADALLQAYQAQTILRYIRDEI